MRPRIGPWSVACVFVVSACGGGDGGGVTNPPPVDRVVTTIDVAALTSDLGVGETVQLIAVVKDQHGAVLTGRVLTWSSGNPAAATVDNAGLVSAVGGGSSVISAASGGKSGSATVTVRPPVATISLSQDTSTVAIGTTVQLTATLKDAQGTALGGRSVTWSSSSPSATVSSAGLVTAVQVGQALVVASVEGKSDTATVLVPAGALTLTKETASASTATIGPAGGTIQATDSDGLHYALIVPPLALMTDVAITMTPLATVTGLPLSGGFVAGVDFQPSGLAFAVAASLTMTTPAQPPAGQRLVGFTASSQGQSLLVTPAAQTSNMIVVPVTHFSAAGAGFGTSADLSALHFATVGLPGSGGLYVQSLTYLSTTTPRNTALELQIYLKWFDTWLYPNLLSATTDAALIDALRDFGEWSHAPSALGLFGVVSGGPLPAQVTARRQQWEQTFVILVKQAIAGNNQVCNAAGSSTSRLAALDNAIYWYHVALLAVGVATAGNGLDEQTFVNALCARIVAQNLVLANPLPELVDRRLDVTFALSLGGGTAIIPENFEVTPVVAGATVQLPGATALNPKGFYSGIVNADPGAGVVIIDLKACYNGHGDIALALGGTPLCGTEHIIRNTSALAITTSVLLPVYEGANYNGVRMEATGGSGSYQWSVTSGSLPSGFSLNTQGVFSGTATTPGLFAFTVTVTSGAASAQRSYSIRVTDVESCSGPGARSGAFIGNQDSVAVLAGVTDIDGALFVVGGGAVVLPSLACMGSRTQVFDFDPANSFPNLTSVDLPALLVSEGRIDIGNPAFPGNATLQRVTFQALRAIDGRIDVRNNPVLNELRFPSLQSWVTEFTLVDNPALTTMIVGPAHVGSFYIQRTGLTSLSGFSSGLVVVGSLNILDNPGLCAADINAFLNRITHLGTVHHNATC